MEEFDTNLLTELAAAAIEEFDHPLVAIEAYWDGDPQGWFLVLSALVDHPDWFDSSESEPDDLPAGLHPRYEECPLHVLQGQGGDLRLFNGLQAPWPEAVAAKVIGEQLARRFGAPFYFPSPSEPDDECPRWWQQDQGQPCSVCGKLIIPSESPYRLRGCCYRCQVRQELQEERKRLAEGGAEIEEQQ